LLALETKYKGYGICRSRLWRKEYIFFDCFSHRRFFSPGNSGRIPIVSTSLFVPNTWIYALAKLFGWDIP
jgi:hypothetical protein